MWPFSNNKAKSRKSETSDIDIRSEEIVDSTYSDDWYAQNDGWAEELPDLGDGETVEVEEIRTKEYTEYTANAKFVDGTDEVFTFDFMQSKDDYIVLGDYIDLVTEEYSFRPDEQYIYGNFATVKNVTIPHTHLKLFETVNREKKEMEYTVTVEKPASEVEE